MSTWPDGSPKSTGNAFDWRVKRPRVVEEAPPPKRVGRPSKTAAEMKKLATRVNREDTVCKPKTDVNRVWKLKRPAI